jgi:uncharacterized protein HemX
VGVQEVAGRLVELALAKGGQDNVTVQFIQFGERAEVQASKAVELDVEDPAAKRPSFAFLIATALLVAGGLLTAIGLTGFFVRQITINHTEEIQQSLQRELNEAVAYTDSIKRRVEDLEIQQGRIRQSTEATDKSVNELKKELSNLKKEVSGLKKKRARA